jgi:hypothetical protein
MVKTLLQHVSEKIIPSSGSKVRQCWNQLQMVNAIGIVYYADQQTHNKYIYIYIYKQYFIYIVSSPTCFNAPASSSGILSFCFATVTKIIRVTNPIKSVD